MKYGKFVISTMVVILFEFGISYLVAQKFNILYLDVMFYVGLSLTLLFIFSQAPEAYLSTATSKTGLKNGYKLKRTFGI